MNNILEITKHKCQCPRGDGAQCEAWAMTDSQFCFRHNPKTEEVRTLASSKGGTTPRKNQNILPAMKIETLKDVVSLLADTINRVRTGELDARIANCLGVLSGHLIHAMEVSELEGRVETIERIILERKTTR